MRGLKYEGNVIQCLIYNVESIRKYDFENQHGKKLTHEDAYKTIENILKKIPAIEVEKTEDDLKSYLDEVEKAVTLYLIDKREDTVKRIMAIINTTLNDRYLIYLSQFSHLLDKFDKQELAFRNKWNLANNLPLITNPLDSEEVFKIFYTEHCPLLNMDPGDVSNVVKDFLQLNESDDAFVGKMSIRDLDEQLDFIMRLEVSVEYMINNFDPYVTFTN